MNFTSDGRAALMCSVREAGRLGHWQHGTEHLLPGLLAAEGPAAERLQAGGLTLRTAREAVEVRHPMPAESGCGRLPHTAELDDVLEAARVASGAQGIGSLDLLAALARSGGIGGQLAARAGVVRLTSRCPGPGGTLAR